jgi:hydrogenase nickel incorporation protein HypA/HybF
MHEVSLCQNAIDLVAEYATREGIDHVSCVRLEIGAGAAVEVEAIRFCFPLLAEGTVLAGAELAIEVIPLRARCRSCGTEYEPEDLVAACPKCGAFGPEFLAGREMRVASFDGKPRHPPGAAPEQAV